MSVGDLRNRIAELDRGMAGTSTASLIEAVIFLESQELVLIGKYAGDPPIFVPYDRAKSRESVYTGSYLGRGQSNLRLTHQGRKYLSDLEKSCSEPATAKRNSPVQMPPELYRLHPEIQRVSGGLYSDGHFKQAALEAYIRVINEVKTKSGIADDGDSLMNRAFGCDKQIPVVQFNGFQTDAERDEQKGIMFLFKGIVALRNSKAHSNTLFNDPSRAHEYLALASLLLRLLEVATVNPKP
ncbi:MAG: TIGR02391 family protein [Terriglobia bacterium]